MALTLSVAENLDEHFGELERAFFAAGDAEPAPADAHLESGFDDLEVVVPARSRRRLVSLYRLGRLWLSMRMRLLLAALLGAVPRRLAVPLLVRTGEAPPRLLARRPVLTVAAAVVLASTLLSVWAGVVLAANRLGS